MLPRWFFSLQFRLTAGFAAALALALTGVGLYSAQATSREIDRFAQEVDQARATRVEQLVSQTYRESRDWGPMQGMLEQAGALLGWHITVTDHEGNVVADSHPVGQPPPPVPPPQLPILVDDDLVGSLFLAPARPGRGSPRFSPGWIRERLRQLGAGDLTQIVAESPFDAATGVSGSLPVSGSAAKDVRSSPEVAVEPQYDRLAASFQSSLLWAGMAAAASGVFVVSLGTRRMLAPVRTLTTAARRLGTGDLSQRVPLAGRDEVGELATTFNEMANDLERAEKQRQVMTAGIAHELRTPLSNVQGYLEAIIDGVVAPDTDTIDTLHEQTMHLSRLVEDLRLTATAEAGALRLEYSPLQIEDIAAETVEAFRTRASKQRVNLVLDAAPDLPAVMADHTRVYQVVTNLVENALMHTPSGGTVDISVARTADDFVRIEVTDTGPGIPPEELPLIFEQFYRVDRSRSRQTGGAGLGLTIVKRLVEAHGGRVGADSAIGRGTRVSVELPVSSNTGEGARIV
jgi:two-component system sensor histidine kinase BaeS